MPAIKMEKTFADGKGLVRRFKRSQILLFYWNDKPDGAARYIAHVGRYARGQHEYASLDKLIAAVEAEHAGE